MVNPPQSQKSRKLSANDALRKITACIIGLVVVGGIAILPFMVVWAIRLAHYSDSNPAKNLMIVPITIIYVVLTSFLAIIAMLSARHSALSANASETAANAAVKSVDELRLATNLQYTTAFGFPNGYVSFVDQHGAASITIKNSYDRPALGLTATIFELELSSNGRRTMKHSSMRQSKPVDLAPLGEALIELDSTQMSDVEKATLANAVYEEYQLRFRKEPTNTILVIQYHTLVLSPILLFDIDLVHVASPLAKTSNSKSAYSKATP